MAERYSACTTLLGAASRSSLGSPLQQTSALKIVVCLKESMLEEGVTLGSWFLLASGSLVLPISGLPGAHTGLVCIPAWLLPPASLTLDPR